MNSGSPPNDGSQAATPAHPINGPRTGTSWAGIQLGATPVIFALCCGLLAGLLPGTTATAHPSHSSIAEADWNAVTGRLEVALQLNPVDLERALRRVAKRPLDLDKSAGIERHLRDYLAMSFVVRQANGKPAQHVWVGHEINLKNAWLYFEVPLPAGPENTTFAAGYFLELQPDQTNTIHFRVGRRRRSLTFSIDQLEAVLPALPGE